MVSPKLPFGTKAFAPIAAEEGLKLSAESKKWLTEPPRDYGIGWMSLVKNLGTCFDRLGANGPLSESSPTETAAH
jgi:hypothetical protein